jgi:pyruvate dehydrogenase E1 component alpha subunit
VDGQDVEAIYSATTHLVQRARSGVGPGFLQCNTYRFYGHHVGDISRTYYRSKQEEEEWKATHDPIKFMADRLVGQGLANREKLESIRAEVQAEINAGVEFALRAPLPTLAEVDQDVYA